MVPAALCKLVSYQITVLELHELLDAFVLVDRVIVGHDAFAVDGCLCNKC